MSARVGLELGPELIRAVRLERWGMPRVRTLELHWDPAAPAEAFAALREGLGSAGRVAVAVDLAFLYAKQIKLPPVGLAEKRRIVALEPERFFPVRSEEMVLALRAEDNLVFAARASMLGDWLAELEPIGPVELVEPSPVSLARALGRVDPGDATILMEEKDQGVGIAEVGAGRVRRVRRIQGDPAEVTAALAAVGAKPGPIYLRSLNGNRGWRPASEVEMESLGEFPAVAGVAASHLAAYGAAVGLGGELDEALLPAEMTRRIIQRRRRALLLGLAACLLGLVFALLSMDGLRSRTLSKLDAAIAGVRVRAEGVLAVERQADSLNREARAASTIEAERGDPAAAMAALTRRLPRGAHLLVLRASGPDWQIEGYAREAAPLVRILEEDPWFEDVHFLSATSRTQLNGAVHESFSIALRVVPAP